MKRLRIYTQGMPVRDKIGHSPIDYLAGKLANGTDTDYHPEPRHLEAQLKRTQESLAKILTILRVNNVINDDDMLDAVGMGSWEIEREGTVVKIEEDE